MRALRWLPGDYEGVDDVQHDTEILMVSTTSIYLLFREQRRASTGVGRGDGDLTVELVLDVMAPRRIADVVSEMRKGQGNRGENRAAGSTYGG